MGTPKPEMTKELERKIDHLLRHKLPLSRVEGKKILVQMVREKWDTRMMAKVLKTSPSNVRVALSDHGIHKQYPPRISTYNPEVEAYIEKCYAKPKHTREESVLARDDMVAGVNAIRAREGLTPVTIKGIRGHVRNRYNWGFRMDRMHAKVTVSPKPVYMPFGPAHWPDADVIQVSKDAWEKPGKRVMYLSRLDFESEGYRQGLVRLAVQIGAQEGIHFPVFAGGLVSKDWFRANEKMRLVGIHPVNRGWMREKFIEEVAQGISSAIPQMKNPQGEVIKWYVMSSPPYDGPYGDLILRKLEELRSDIRKYAEGGERVEIYNARGNESMYHGVVLPKRGRLPSGYMSPGPEREIKDIESQTSREFPDLWVVGTPATALHKPSGEREVAYITLPAIRKLEAKDKKMAENQTGFIIVEEMPNGDRFVHTWNFRDIIARERELITGIKDGANSIHRKIVDVIKREGARHPGRLADEIGVTHDMVMREIEFLVEKKPSPRQTWPGLRYDESSERYDLHQDWIRRSLRYRVPESKGEWQEDSAILLGCMHAGYTTADYEFIIMTIAEKMLAYNIPMVVGAGDFIGGLYHHMRERGEVFNLSYPEQEEFAAELVATILVKVFRERFTRAWKARSNHVTSVEFHQMVESALPFFPFIRGNHDKWQLNDSQEPLAKVFLPHLLKILRQNVHQTLIACGAPEMNVEPIVEKRVKFLDPQYPIFELPSKVRCAVIHPEMGRAGSSLRLEKELERFSVPKYRANAVFVANFHTAVHAHKWHPVIGQCVGIQTGAPLLLTDFEFNKTKEVDFGVQMVKILSVDGKIIRTTVASFNKPIMKKPYSRRTDIDAIRKELGILS